MPRTLLGFYHKCYLKATFRRVLWKHWLILSYKRGQSGSNVGVVSAKMNACTNKDSGEVIKNYHKQAFEYISRALRIDEDDTGLLFHIFLFLLCVVALLIGCDSLPVWWQERKNRLCSGTRKGLLSWKGALQWSSPEKVSHTHTCPNDVSVVALHVSAWLVYRRSVWTSEETSR